MNSENPKRDVADALQLVLEKMDEMKRFWEDSLRDVWLEFERLEKKKADRPGGVSL